MFRKSVEKPTEGEVRMFGPTDRRRFSTDQGRWLNDDDYEKQKKGNQKPTDQHQSQKQELQSHKLEQWQKDIKVGDEVKYRGLRVKVTDIADHMLAVKSRLGKHFAISRTSASEAPVPEEEENRKYVDRLKQYIYRDFETITPEDLDEEFLSQVKDISTERRYFHDGQWEPERSELHSAFLNIQTAEVPKDLPEGKREAIVLAGGGGTGKSTILRTLYGDLKSNRSHVWVDADEAKEFIPEYQILRAADDYEAASIAHEESSHMSKQLISEAIKNKQNVVIDGALSNPGKAEKLYHELKQNGYKVRLVLVDADYDTALMRAHNRSERSKRAVDPAILRHANGKAAFRNGV